MILLIKRREDDDTGLAHQVRGLVGPETAAGDHEVGLACDHRGENDPEPRRVVLTVGVDRDDVLAPRCARAMLVAELEGDTLAHVDREHRAESTGRLDDVLGAVVTPVDHDEGRDLQPVDLVGNALQDRADVVGLEVARDEGDDRADRWRSGCDARNPGGRGSSRAVGRRRGAFRWTAADFLSASYQTGHAQRRSSVTPNTERTSGSKCSSGFRRVIRVEARLVPLVSELLAELEPGSSRYLSRAFGLPPKCCVVVPSLEVLVGPDHLGRPRCARRA